MHQPQGGKAVLCRVFRAPCDEGCDYSEYSGARPNEHVCSASRDGDDREEPVGVALAVQRGRHEAEEGGEAAAALAPGGEDALEPAHIEAAPRARLEAGSQEVPDTRPTNRGGLGCIAGLYPLQPRRVQKRLLRQLLPARQHPILVGQPHQPREADQPHIAAYDVVPVALERRPN